MVYDQINKWKKKWAPLASLHIIKLSKIRKIKLYTPIYTVDTIAWKRGCPASPRPELEATRSESQVTFPCG